MKSSQQIRRIGILCLILSGAIFGLTLLSDAKAEASQLESTPVSFLEHGQMQTIVPVSPWFIYGKQVGSRFFALAATALVSGLLLVERAKMIRRLDAMENELLAMRAFLPRS
jgi:hypothetical protein